MPILIVEYPGPRRGAKLPPRVLIGRRSMNHLVVDHRDVSRMHAWIDRVGERFVLTDMRSRTGTTVNGRRLPRSRALADGDVIAVGPAKLTFLAGDALPPGVEPLVIPPVPAVSHRDVGVRFDCPHCQAPMWAAPQFGGHLGSCVYCGEEFTVPAWPAGQAGVAVAGPPPAATQPLAAATRYAGGPVAPAPDPTAGLAAAPVAAPPPRAPSATPTRTLAGAPAALASVVPSSIAGLVPVAAATAPAGPPPLLPPMPADPLLPPEVFSELAPVAIAETTAAALASPTTTLAYPTAAPPPTAVSTLPDAAPPSTFPQSATTATVPGNPVTRLTGTVGPEQPPSSLPVVAKPPPTPRPQPAGPVAGTAAAPATPAAPTTPGADRRSGDGGPPNGHGPADGSATTDGVASVNGTVNGRPGAVREPGDPTRGFAAAGGAARPAVPPAAANGPGGEPATTPNRPARPAMAPSRPEAGTLAAAEGFALAVPAPRPAADGRGRASPNPSNGTLSAARPTPTRPSSGGTPAAATAMPAAEVSVRRPPPPAAPAAPPKPRCSVCQSGIEPGEAQVTCPSCKLVFHDECWYENFGCSAYGCQEVNALAPPESAADADDASLGDPWSEAGHADVPPPPRKPWEFVLLAASVLATIVGAFTFGAAALAALAGGVAYLVRTRADPDRRTAVVVAAIALSAAGAAAGAVTSYFLFVYGRR